MPDHGPSEAANQEVLNTEGLVVSDGWIRPAPPNVPSMAAYLNLTNESDSDINIVGIESSNFSMAMIHETIIEDDVAKMQHMSELIIPAGETVKLTPLGTHMMLMRPIEPLSLGDITDLTMISQNGARFTYKIEVKEAPK